VKPLPPNSASKVMPPLVFCVWHRGGLQRAVPEPEERGAPTTPYLRQYRPLPTFSVMKACKTAGVDRCSFLSNVLGAWMRTAAKTGRAMPADGVILPAAHGGGMGRQTRLA